MASLSYNNNPGRTVPVDADHEREELAIFLTSYFSFALMPVD
jgi:hypothetical protein